MLFMPASVFMPALPGIGKSLRNPSQAGMKEQTGLMLSSSEGWEIASGPAGGRVFFHARTFGVFFHARA